MSFRTVIDTSLGMSACAEKHEEVCKINALVHFVVGSTEVDSGLISEGFRDHFGNIQVTEIGKKAI